MIKLYEFTYEYLNVEMTNIYFDYNIDNASEQFFKDVKNNLSIDSSYNVIEKNVINDNCLGVLYLCKYNYKTQSIIVKNVILFDKPFDALNAFANIPNPESQVAYGKNRESFLKELTQLDNNMQNQKWLTELADTL